MPDLIIRTALPADIDSMAGRLRPDHVAELADRGMTPRQALERGMRYSIEAWTALEGAEPVAMWGLTCPAVLGDMAHPWLITTAATLRHKLRFWRECKAGIVRMAARYPVLVNEFDRTDGEACRILARLGFALVGDGRYSTFVRL
jgi:hypothetical protein